MRLQSLVPHIPQNLIDVFSACGIKTDTDLLFPSGDIFSKLPPGTMSLQEFHSLVEHVAERAAAPSVCGDIMLAQQRDIHNEYMHGNILSGVPQLDEILGGLHPPRVVEVSGDKGSGKSSFALQVVLRHLAANFDSGALWIDTGGDFSVERIPPILESIEGQAKPTVLERLQVALAFDIETVHDVLEQLRSDLSSDPRPLPTVHCVVIDAITPLLGPRLSAVSSQGHAIMTAFMRQLRALAEAFSITFLVINSSTRCLPQNPDSAFATTDKKPSLGPSFAFLTDTTLWLSRCDPSFAETEEGSSLHTAEVFRSRKTRSKTWCSFKIRQGILSGS